MNDATTIRAFRGEGPNHDPIWNARTWKTFETAEGLDAKLAEVAATLTRGCVDKFDIEVVLSDGSTVECMWLLERGERPAGAVRQILEGAGKKA